MINPCVLIPVYDHEKLLGKILKTIQGYRLPCIIVDDGSHSPCKDELVQLADKFDFVTLVVHPVNRGKGAAVKSGIRAAFKAGYSHVLQVDADGQHDLEDFPSFIERSRSYPDAIVLGVPVFDSSIPKSRKYPRYLTHVWVWINTLSFCIKDSMCGYRMYPVVHILEIIENNYLGDRMDFDIELVVKSYWNHLQLQSVPTKVRYLSSGVSHFRPWQDNLLITTMHTRLFFGMLGRLPELLSRKLAEVKSSG